MAFRFPVRGDFEYRAEFELLELSKPQTTLAIGVNVYVTSNSDAKVGLWLGKMLDPKLSRHLPHRGPGREGEGRKTLVETKFPTPDAKGRAKIRLARKGPQVFMWAGDRAAPQIEKVRLGEDDLADVPALAAEPGNRANTGRRLPAHRDVPRGQRVGRGRRRRKRSVAMPQSEKRFSEESGHAVRTPKEFHSTARVASGAGGQALQYNI